MVGTAGLPCLQRKGGGNVFFCTSAQQYKACHEPHTGRISGFFWCEWLKRPAKAFCQGREINPHRRDGVSCKVRMTAGKMPGKHRAIWFFRAEKLSAGACCHTLGVLDTRLQRCRLQVGGYTVCQTCQGQAFRSHQVRHGSVNLKYQHHLVLIKLLGKYLWCCGMGRAPWSESVTGTAGRPRAEFRKTAVNYQFPWQQGTGCRGSQPQCLCRQCFSNGFQ